MTDNSDLWTRLGVAALAAAAGGAASSYMNPEGGIMSALPGILMGGLAGYGGAPMLLNHLQPAASKQEQDLMKIQHLLLTGPKNKYEENLYREYKDKYGEPISLEDREAEMVPHQQAKADQEFEALMKETPWYERLYMRPVNYVARTARDIWAPKGWETRPWFMSSIKERERAYEQLDQNQKMRTELDYLERGDTKGYDKYLKAKYNWKDEDFALKKQERIENMIGKAPIKNPEYEAATKKLQEDIDNGLNLKRSISL